MHDVLQTVRDEVDYWREKAERHERQKSGLAGLCFLGGLAVAFVFCDWASTPAKQWEVDPNRPIISFHYRFWSQHKRTDYIWATNSEGDPAWITVDDEVRPTGGSLPTEP